MTHHESAPRRRSAREWARLVEDWKKSGQTVQDFAKRRGLPPRRLSWWKWRLAARSRGGEDGLRLVPVVVEPLAPLPGSMSAAEWEVVTAGGHVLRLRGAMAAADVAVVLATLELATGRR
jgi:hypothetical protein